MPDLIVIIISNKQRNNLLKKVKYIESLLDQLMEKQVKVIEIKFSKIRIYI